MRPGWRFTRILYRLPLVFILPALVGCVRPSPTSSDTGQSQSVEAAETRSEDTPSPDRPLIEQLGTAVPAYSGRPTADAAHYDTTVPEGGALGNHTVAAGDTLGLLAQRYSTTVEQLMSLNGLTDPDLLQVGQTLQVPGVDIQKVVGPDFKIIPDSELLYGPGAKGFDAGAFLVKLGGYVTSYHEEVEGQSMDGPAILQLVADRHSVNPRLLIAIVEHQTGWITRPSPPSTTINLGYSGTGSPGFYGQLSWAANLLNLGFYGRAEGGLRGFNLGDDTQIAFSPIINDGTAGVQRYFGAVNDVTYDTWQQTVGAEGFLLTFTRLFGNPFAYTFEPLLPAGLDAPPMELPWDADETWYFTGGPHGAWNSGSAWGALDFVPPGEAGCVQSEAWVTSMTDGVVVRSGHGAVVIDMDGDNYAGTGWAITYMHLETRDRIALGTAVKTGDHLGHPSCEGGFSNGTHLHITRSYNGRWISADGDLPFVMSGWVSSGAGAEYDGYLTRGAASRVACVCREEVNAINR
ncbi:MAG: LysM peptidoglycan-binding domain-containing protein [Anaerolineae bacterium]|uniref:M23 family metallopeptidase n=1 Tax=Promineifilum sp. TaxID=2664178 RepID=UPI001DA0D88E|nr:LysM peptidoglycan-binding domain-containing protein [Anaerolineales bacterium]MCB8934700.1 LysM peptidoglycan-binding domain-containing protein [Promineifilum sp.]MCO5180942.1 LysM peptidoglycan-binding domain-containing protein [Promineifilum sp.]MCW5846696.1 LysM peptidoglycan-binding domain-containing protein [Anaerolineae bacterium]